MHIESHYRSLAGVLTLHGWRSALCTPFHMNWTWYVVVLASLPLARISSAAVRHGTPVIATVPCTVRVVSSRPVRTVDGRYQSLEAQSLATTGASLIALGSNTHAWQAGVAAPNDSEHLIGLWVDEQGTIRPVPSPFQNRRVEFPRASSAGDDGWHVVFITEAVRSAAAMSSRNQGIAADGDSLWYGRYDSTGWHDIEFVSSVARGIVNSSRSSRLLSGTTTDLYFAYGYVGSARWSTDPDPAHESGSVEFA